MDGVLRKPPETDLWFSHRCAYGHTCSCTHRCAHTQRHTTKKEEEKEEEGEKEEMTKSMYVRCMDYSDLFNLFPGSCVSSIALLL